MKKHVIALLAALSLFTALVLPANAEIALSTGRSSMSNGGQTVTMEFMFTCEFAGSYTISASLSQSVGRVQNFGSAYTTGYCGQGEHVTVPLGIPSGRGLPFRAGPAQLEATMYVYGQDPNNPENYLYDDGTLQTVVRLRK